MLSVHVIINMCMMPNMCISLLIIAFTDIEITQIHYNSVGELGPLSWHGDLYLVG